VVLVQGANMAGKTTYLKTVGVSAVLAHAGAFVPAEFASFRVLHQIMTVAMTQSDALEENASTFMVECRELARALQASPSSLVLVDELGRATSTSDAFALCFASAEQLLSSGALTLFATHLERLADLTDLYPGVKASMLRCALRPGAGLQFSYELAEGSSRDGLRMHYGVALARSAGLTPAVTDDSERIVALLEQKAARALVSNADMEAEQTLHGIAQRLMTLHECAHIIEDDEALRTTLRRLYDTAARLASACATA
jgi:DNA mismatch repair protein MSH4